MENEIELGDEVKCKYTNIRGTVTSKTEFINGCIQCGITTKWDGKGEPKYGEVDIDSQSLVITKKVKKEPTEKSEKSNGGPSRSPKMMKGF